MTRARTDSTSKSGEADTRFWLSVIWPILAQHEMGVHEFQAYECGVPEFQAFGPGLGASREVTSTSPPKISKTRPLHLLRLPTQWASPAGMSSGGMGLDFGLMPQSGGRADAAAQFGLAVSAPARQKKSGDRSRIPRTQ